MGKDSTNSGMPVFGEILKLLLKQEINTIAEELQSDRYTKRLDSYQHLVIMLYAVLRQVTTQELEHFHKLSALTSPLPSKLSTCFR